MTITKNIYGTNTKRSQGTNLKLYRNINQKHRKHSSFNTISYSHRKD